MEAGFEPQVQREIVPALIGEIWSQFLLVPLSEHGFIQLP